jgi:hypothetical protein
MANIIRRENHNNNDVARTTGSDYRWDPFRMGTQDRPRSVDDISRAVH